MAFSAPRDKESQERPLPRGIHLRRGTAEDEIITFEVMRRAMGFEMSWAHHAAARHHVRSSPCASFWLAEELPRFGPARVIGYARSLVRDQVWNLTEFFVLPGHHRQGVGGALLAGCLKDGRRAGATTHLVLASHHPGADALYVRKAGCFPRLPMLLLAGSTANLSLPETVTARIGDLAAAPKPASARGASASTPHEKTATLSAEPMILTSEVQRVLDALDRDIVGYARPPEHAHWTAQMGGQNGASRLFRRTSLGPRGEAAGSIAGYAYIGAHSSGPVLAQDPADLPHMIAHVAAIARARPQNSLDFASAQEQYWAIAGTNEVMLRWLLQCGWQIVFQYLLMSSRPLGRFDHYVCHNPLYFP